MERQFTPEYRKALGSYITGVTVVTTIEKNGTHRGITANSFTSVSLSPPLVSVCIAKTASSAAAFRTTGLFCVSILSQGQDAVASIFASKSHDKFSNKVWSTSSNGCAKIDGAVAWLACTVSNIVDAGDHFILIGEVTDFESNTNDALAFWRGAFLPLGLPTQAAEASLSGTAQVGVLLEHQGRVLLRYDNSGYDLPRAGYLETSSYGSSVRSILQQLDIHYNIVFLYSVVEENNSQQHFSIYYRGYITSFDRERLGEYDLVGLGEIEKLTFLRHSVKSMLNRYARERGDNLFGVYAGGSFKGVTTRLQPSEDA